VDRISPPCVLCRCLVLLTRLIIPLLALLHLNHNQIPLLLRPQAVILVELYLEIAPFLFDPLVVETYAFRFLIQVSLRYPLQP
jgi:hypothetical protein